MSNTLDSCNVDRYSGFFLSQNLMVTRYISNLYFIGIVFIAVCLVSMLVLMFQKCLEEDRRKLVAGLKKLEEDLKKYR